MNFFGPSFDQLQRAHKEAYELVDSLNFKVAVGNYVTLAAAIHIFVINLTFIGIFGTVTLLVLKNHYLIHESKKVSSKIQAIYKKIGRKFPPQWELLEGGDRGFLLAKNPYRLSLPKSRIHFRPTHLSMA